MTGFQPRRYRSGIHTTHPLEAPSCNPIAEVKIKLRVARVGTIWVAQRQEVGRGLPCRDRGCLRFPTAPELTRTLLQTQLDSSSWGGRDWNNRGRAATRGQLQFAPPRSGALLRSTRPFRGREIEGGPAACPPQCRGPSASPEERGGLADRTGKEGWLLVSAERIEKNLSSLRDPGCSNRGHPGKRPEFVRPGLITVGISTLRSPDCANHGPQRRGVGPCFGSGPGSCERPQTGPEMRKASARVATRILPNRCLA